MSGENPRILCVDDDLPVLSLLEDMLVPEHFDVIKAENADQEIERFSNNRIDIVLAGGGMKGSAAAEKGDGIEV